MSMFIPYTEEMELTMVAYFKRLNERDARHYAAIEAMKLDHGGVTYIARLFDITRDRIYNGIRELGAMRASLTGDADDDDPNLPPEDRVRRPGAGRPPATDRNPQLENKFLQVIEDRTAGDPTDEARLWTDLTVREISEHLRREGCAEAGEHVVRGLLEDNDFHQLALRKELATGKVDPLERNMQFENIFARRDGFIAAGEPAIAVDTKKKELIGTLHRDGKLYIKEGQLVYDHDYRHLAEGKAIPQGIYDYANNNALINVGTSAETPRFICDGISQWWNYRGRHDYPQASEIMITLDAGGPSGVRCNVFKEQLAALADKIGKTIRIAHYPPYTSKWHPIEHRLFPHVTRALSGVILKTFELVKQLIGKTKTSAGLEVKAYMLDGEYKTGIKCSPGWKEERTKRVERDDMLPDWNYVIRPI